MAQYFDESKWREWLKQPDWYLRFRPEYEALIKRAKDSDEATGRDINDEVRSFFEEALLTGEVALGESGDDLDTERKPVDTIVIHHTSNQPGYFSLPRLNAVHLLNLYVPYYQEPYLESEKHLKGQPIWSNHFDDSGKQVFYAYHWFVRMDGTVQRLLGDDQIGWQAGNWEINTRSVAICFDNDYENATPEPKVLVATAQIISEYYGQVAHDRILGHCEVNPKSVCPGNPFLHGWKKDLLDQLGTKDGA